MRIINNQTYDINSRTKIRKQGKIFFLEKLYAHGFFLFFTAQILSPSLDNRTIYLEILIAFLNPFFLIWISKQRIKLKYYIISIGILSLFLVDAFLVSIKLLTTSISVMFLFYAYSRKIFYLKYYIFISIIFAIFQFVFTFINPSIARVIGPHNIAHTIWGSYATATFTNFYTVFFFPRVSGLSRESGFFASLLLSYILYIYIEGKRYNHQISFIEKITLFFGYIISFSKMSLLLIPLILVEKFKKIINLINPILVALFFVIFMIFFWSSNIDYLTDSSHDSFLHRFAGYPTLLAVNLKQFLLGVAHAYDINTNLANLVSLEFQFFAGFGGFILNNGFIVVLVIFLTFLLSGVKGAGIAILLIGTMNVQIDTNQNFVVLIYFILLKYYTFNKVIWRENANN